ncbi:MAG TPA: trypsin-like peptidase domain-containing protein [Acidimicrobiia bacterium]|nr:trypsin-like peptidase domain-containing protein [Acidimicrobiia bacterium]
MEPDDEEGLEPYRSPDDRERIWLHPSELGSLLPPVAGSPRSDPGRRRGRHRSRALTVPVLSGMIGASVSLAILVLAGGLDRPRTDRVVERVTNLPVHDLAAQDGISALAAAVAPAIVALRATTPTGDRFGSGVVFRSDGHVLTNFHLVDGATSIELTCADGKSHAARQMGADPETDLAVLSLDEDTDMEPAVLGSARSLQVGQTAIVVGAPGGPQGSPSVTAGVIAGLGEVVEVGGHRLYDMISTDAMIGPRASGGPLVDRSGAVVGITTRSGGADGSLGLVIPIDVARKVAEKLIAEGRVTYAWLGVSGTDLDPWTAKEYGVGTGTLIRRVTPKSPADQSGLKVQDVVTAVENLPISTMNELMMLVRRHDPGERVDLTVVRSGVKRNVKVRLTGTPNGN